jgi:hypothetical protein
MVRFVVTTGAKTMTDILTAIAGAIGITKQLLEIVSVSKDAAAKTMIADLQLQLAEIKSRLSELINENTSLREDLRKATSREDEVVFRNGLYYSPSGDGPFCAPCWDDKKKKIRVSGDDGIFDCPICNHTVMTPEAKARQDETIREISRMNRY